MTIDEAKNDLLMRTDLSSMSQRINQPKSQSLSACAKGEANARFGGGFGVASRVARDALALGADAEDTHGMLRRLEAVRARDFVLQSEQFVGEEFDGAPALGADHMIVMREFVIRLVARPSIP